uniref:Uncharacterized protein n=1 Tax=Meloidogyne enterolobii TaxID=390850 RepID=A0A6V7U4M7_MELEN|nr:unnamed protein product [Meloidogyne enterolobii]
MCSRDVQKVILKSERRKCESHFKKRTAKAKVQKRQKTKGEIFNLRLSLEIPWSGNSKALLSVPNLQITLKSINPGYRRICRIQKL